MKPAESHVAAEIVGWLGTAAIVVAYVGVSFKFVSATGWLYQLLNFGGALGIVVIAWVKRIRQTIFLNIFWAVIAVGAMVALVAGKH